MFFPSRGTDVSSPRGCTTESVCSKCGKLKTLATFRQNPCAARSKKLGRRPNAPVPGFGDALRKARLRPRLEKRTAEARATGPDATVVY